MTIGSSVRLAGGELSVRGHAVLSGRPSAVSASSASARGPVDAVSLGAMRVWFMACFRFMVWWMAHNMGDKGGHVPHETQFLLVESKAGAGARSKEHDASYYYSTHFTQVYLKGHMYEGHTDLPIKAGNGRANVIARLIMGVDKRATITRNWAQFFDMANMRGGASYAFAFEELVEELHLTVHSL